MFLQLANTSIQMLNLALESLNDALLQLFELAADKVLNHGSTCLKCLEQLGRLADLFLQGIFQAAARVHRVKKVRHRLHKHMLGVATKVAEVAVEGC